MRQTSAIPEEAAGQSRPAAALLTGARAMPVELRPIHANFLRHLLRQGGGILAAVRHAIAFARETCGVASAAPANPPVLTITSGDTP